MPRIPGFIASVGQKVFALHPRQFELGCAKPPLILSFTTGRAFCSNQFLASFGFVSTISATLWSKQPISLILTLVRFWLIFETGSPQRGDVFVFHYPKDPSIDYIKRVIGLPGDNIKYENKKLFVNDVEVSQTYTSIYKYSLKQDLEVSAKEFVEDHGDYSHSILIHDIPSESVEFVVPDGHYFAMGDNRDNSSDSRVWGFVPDELLVGKAFAIWLNFSEPNRIGNWIN